MEQQANIARVGTKIAPFVYEFCADRLKTGASLFVINELQTYVMERMGNDGVAPASPDRILRDLRRRGVIKYNVVSRHQSLYEVLGVY